MIRPALVTAAAVSDMDRAELLRAAQTLRGLEAVAQDEGYADALDEAAEAIRRVLTLAAQGVR